MDARRSGFQVQAAVQQPVARADERSGAGERHSLTEERAAIRRTKRDAPRQPHGAEEDGEQESEERTSHPPQEWGGQQRLGRSEMDGSTAPEVPGIVGETQRPER